MTEQERNQLEQRLSAAFDQLHGYAASIGDSRQRYNATNDARYITAINNVIPLYNAALARYSAIAKQLGTEERPAEFLLTLSETSDFLKQTALNAGDAVTSVAREANTTAKFALVAIAVVALAYVSGSGALGKLTSGGK